MKTIDNQNREMVKMCGITFKAAEGELTGLRQFLKDSEEIVIEKQGEDTYEIACCAAKDILKDWEYLDGEECISCIHKDLTIIGFLLDTSGICHEEEDEMVYDIF